MLFIVLFTIVHLSIFRFIDIMVCGLSAGYIWYGSLPDAHPSVVSLWLHLTLHLSEWTFTVQQVWVHVRVVVTRVHIILVVYQISHD
mgnify:CR=1 FL=1